MCNKKSLKNIVEDVGWIDITCRCKAKSYKDGYGAIVIHYFEFGEEHVIALYGNATKDIDLWESEFFDSLDKAKKWCDSSHSCSKVSGNIEFNDNDLWEKIKKWASYGG